MHIRSSFVVVIAVTMALAGCGTIATVRSFSTAYVEPTTGDLARLRIRSNGMVRAVPGKTCVDWRTPGAGVMLAHRKGFANLNDRDLGMPQEVYYSPKDLSRRVYSVISSERSTELRIAADQPITLNFISDGSPQGGNIYRCASAISFVPERGMDYEIVFFDQGIGSRCTADLTRIDQDTLRKKPIFLHVPVDTQHAGLCHVTDML